jgi:hypothetical protein
VPGVVQQIEYEYPNGIVLELLGEDLFEYTQEY